MVIPALVTKGLSPWHFSPRPDSDIWLKAWKMLPGFHGIEAASGRGKSSFIRHIAGLAETCAGSIEFDASGQGRMFAVLDQALLSIPHLTVSENVRIGLPDGEWRQSILTNLLKEFAVFQLLDKPMGQISLGERQRVLLARTLSQDAAWYLLDEPFSHVDLKLSKIMLEACNRRVEQGRACLISTLDFLGDQLASVPNCQFWRL